MGSMAQATSPSPNLAGDHVATTVSRFRLYLLRAVYLFVVVGLGDMLLPKLLNPVKDWDYPWSVITCMLTAFWLLTMLGLRYPIRMLPILFWEIVWKTLWLAMVALPQWRSGHMDQAVQGNVFACATVVLFYLAVPWGHVFERYVKARGDRW
jgi:hypothetical protein